MHIEGRVLKTKEQVALTIRKAPWNASCFKPPDVHSGVNYDKK